MFEPTPSGAPHRSTKSVTGSTPRVGLVLGAGGIAGFAFHTGVLSALNRLTGWDPRTAEVMLGTSAGSNVTALLRGNVPIAQILNRVLTVPTDPDAMEVLRQVGGRGGSLRDMGVGPSSPRLLAREVMRCSHIRPSRLLAALLPTGPIDNTIVGQAADQLHGDDWPSATTWLTAIDLASGRRAVFGHADERSPGSVSVSQAVRASGAIPGFFRPVEINGRRYVDGGLHSATNADLVADLGLDLVVISSPMSAERIRLRSPMNLAIRSLPAFQLRAEIRAIRNAGAEVLVIEPDDDVMRTVGPNPMDPTRALPVLLESNAASLTNLKRPELAAQLQILANAAAVIESPIDVDHPEMIV